MPVIVEMYELKKLVRESDERNSLLDRQLTLEWLLYLKGLSSESLKDL